jgi:polyisoprenyl-phosphate glycosyltransferase
MTLSHLFTGKAVTYLPIDYRTRIGKSKVRIVRDSLRTLQYIAESIATFNPTKLFLMLAILEVIIGLIGMLVAWWLPFVGLLCAVLTFSVGLAVHSVKRR